MKLLNVLQPLLPLCTQDLWAKDLSPPLLGHKHHGSVVEGWTTERWSPGSLTRSENSVGKAQGAGDCELLSFGLYLGRCRNSLHRDTGMNRQPVWVAAALRLGSVHWQEETLLPPSQLPGSSSFLSLPGAEGVTDITVGMASICLLFRHVALGNSPPFPFVFPLGELTVLCLSSG